MKDIKRRSVKYLFCLFIFSTQSIALPILNRSVYVEKAGQVDITFLGHTADYSNDLFLYYWNESITSFEEDNSIGLIFNNQTDPVGTQRMLGTFSAGQELIFGIKVRSTGNTFFSGDASRNPDEMAHVIVNDKYILNNKHAIYIGFEDIFGGGDKDYDDCMFAITNTTQSVPEPSIIPLLAIALIPIVAFKQKHRT